MIHGVDAFLLYASKPNLVPRAILQVAGAILRPNSKWRWRMNPVNSTGDDLHVSLDNGFKIRLAGIVPVSLEFTE